MFFFLTSDCSCNKSAAAAAAAAKECISSHRLIDCKSSRLIIILVQLVRWCVCVDVAVFKALHVDVETQERVGCTPVIGMQLVTCDQQTNLLQQEINVMFGCSVIVSSSVSVVSPREKSVRPVVVCA